LSKTDIAVAVYDRHTQAESAVRKLQHTGFDMKKISILGKDYETEEHVAGYFNAGDRAKFFGKPDWLLRVFGYIQNRFMHTRFHKIAQPKICHPSVCDADIMLGP
jgi:hypothetical protein